MSKERKNIPVAQETLMTSLGPFFCFVSLILITSQSSVIVPSLWFHCHCCCHCCRSIVDAIPIVVTVVSLILVIVVVVVVVSIVVVLVIAILVAPMIHSVSRGLQQWV